MERRSRLEVVSAKEEVREPPHTPEAVIAEILSLIQNVAVLPQVIGQIVEATGDTEGHVARLERAILVDPGFSTMLLAQANSAFFALPKKVTSIREAVMFIGFKGVRKIAMTVGAFDLFIGKTDSGSLRRRHWWRQSLETALFCQVVAPSIEQVKADEAYTCGLLHLLGKTLLDRFDGERYQKVQAAVDQGAPDVLAERAVFNCDHVQLAGAAAEKWRFPEVLILGLNYFTPTRESSPTNNLRATVALGSKVVRYLGSGLSVAQIDSNLIPAWILETLDLTDNRLKSLIFAGVAGLEAASTMVA